MKTLIRLKPEIHEKLMRRSRLKSNDVLFAIVGATIGKVGIFHVGYEANINQAVSAVRLTTDVLPHFAHAFFLTRLGQEQIQRIKRPVARANINLDEISMLRIPVFSESKQREIISALSEAFTKKITTEAKADELLRGIDDVLLEELGIPRDPEPPNTLETRMFQRTYSNLSGNRIDPASNWRKLSFAGGRFPLKKLRDVVAINPATRFSIMDPETPVSFVPMDAVSEHFGEIAERQTRAVGSAGSYTLFQEGDIIWAKITPCMENGKAALATDLQEGVGFGSTEFHVFRTRTDDPIPAYLHHLLRLRMVRKHARLNFTGTSGHQRVDQQFFDRLEIPLPPRKIQERIADAAESAKSQARDLRELAHADLENAKRDIESLILGKEAVA